MNVLRRHRQAAGPTLVSTLASAVSAGTTLVIARGAGAAAFGRFTLVLSIALIVAVGMLMSLHYVMLQELPRAAPAERPALVATALTATLGLGLAVLAAGLAAAGPLTRLLGVGTGTLALALVLALSLTLYQLTEGLLRGLGRYREVAAAKLAAAGCYLGVSLFCLLVLDVGDAEVYVAALVVTNLAFALTGAVLTRAPRRSWSARLARTLYRHGACVTVIAALTAVLFGVDVVFLNHWAERADVGVYSVYNGFPKRLLGVVFTDGIGLVLLPALALADKVSAMRRIARLTPAVAAGTALFSFAASTVFFLLAGPGYPYDLALMALSAAGIGAHTAFNLYSVALAMDGLRGARVLIGCLLAGVPAGLACQALCIGRWGLTGGLAAFALSNLILLVLVMAAAARKYRPGAVTESTEPASCASPSSSTSTRPTSPRDSAATPS
ncbi:hypothetical protein [Actinocorallia longicatena]|uniref:O-antigen/teichoic acid export membrane protein n=1 Tax=Actinocorallia longicatena TaxID=111803 RepID=A0ABP6QB92_9ACTN